MLVGQPIPGGFDADPSEDILARRRGLHSQTGVTRAKVGLRKTPVPRSSFGFAAGSGILSKRACL